MNCFLGWGYPFDLDQFKFHITLTDKLSAPDAEQAHTLLSSILAPLLLTTLRVDTLSLLGEADGGFLHSVDRRKLTG